MSLLARLLRVWMSWILAWPGLVLLIAFALCVASVVLTVTRLEMVTDQLELIAEDHPLVALSDRMDPFNRDSKRRLDVVIEAPTPQQAVAFVRELASRIAKDPEHFQSMIYRVDPERFKAWQLLYLDPKDLVALNDKMKSHESLIRGFAERPELLSFLELLNREMASRMVGELFTGFLDEGDPAVGKKEPFDLGFLITTLEGMSSSLHGSATFVSPWSTLLKDAAWEPLLEGYFWEGEKRYLIAFAIPRKTAGSVLASEEALTRLRKHIQEVQASFPGVKAGVTGQEALNNDEMSTVMEDMEVATWLSLVGVFLLMVAFRRSFRRPVLQIISLGVGLCWSFGCATLVVGHLNMFSIVFAPLLCGLGVDSGIHWFSRLEEEERGGGRDMRQVIRRVNERSGPGILLAGLGTTLSFLPFLLTAFKGLMELGLITGMGILLNLVADFSVLPALTVLLGGRVKAATLSPATAGPRDLISFTPRHARMVLSGAGVLALICLVSANQVYFDLNPMRLQAANAESVVWEKTLVENSQRSALFASAFAASPEEATAKTKAFQALQSVLEVESVFSLLPADQEEKLPLLRSLIPLIPAMHDVPLREHELTDLEAFMAILERIRFKLQDDQAARWGAEKPLVEQMTRVRGLAQEIIETLQSTPEAMARLTEYRRRFLDDVVSKWHALREGVHASSMTVADLPETLRAWFYQGGTYLLRVFPKESVWQEHALARFVRELQSVDPQVVGPPVALYVFASAFRSACIKASAFAVIAILILLLLTFRNLRLTALAFVPLGLGTLWTVGIMGFADVQFNLANSIFMPLVVGAGVEYAVIVLSRWQEGRMLPGHLPLSTAKGVILAALTTTVGFGALMISHHRGIFSLGFVAWAGSICVLLCALFVLPAVLAGMAPQEAPVEE